MPPNSKLYAVPKPGVPRPHLPTDVNPFIRTMDTSKPPAVKFQEIVRDGSSTIVGRVKIPTPGGGHAFILRRLDTGAISVTTMFRAAFPNATEDEEKGEINWIKLSFDTAGANKSGKARFAGHWVTPDVALYLADGYSLGHIIPPLAAAVPDPNTTFRRPKNQQQPTPTASPAAEPGPAPAKRRREASPVQSPAAAAVPPAPTPAEAPVSPPPSRSAASPPPRRSARLKSPPPAAPGAQSFSALSPKTPRSRRAARDEMPTPAGSDETAVEDDAEAAKVAEPKMHEDVQEQKELIAKLKADRAAKVKQEADKLTKSQGVNETDSVEDGEDGAGAKRQREEEPTQYKLNIKEPSEIGDRAIATNSRVRGRIAPERKSLAWGALAFAAGMGAITFLPNLQSMFL